MPLWPHVDVVASIVVWYRMFLACPEARVISHGSRFRAGFALLIGLAVSDRAAAQLPIPAGSSEAEIVAAAQLEATTFPRLEVTRTPSRSFLTVQTGTSDRRCIEGNEIGPVRSGEFVIGGQLSGSRAMEPGRPGKIWWAPLNHSIDMGPLLVRGRNINSPLDTVRYTTKTVAWPVTSDTPVPEADREYFYPSGITIPKSGRWLLVASSGGNWGCFIITTR
jgi:hypothetical protein